MKTATLVILRSSDAKKWKPVLPAKVPAWIREDPEVVGRLHAGDMARRGKGAWYRAERGPKPKLIVAGLAQAH